MMAEDKPTKIAFKTDCRGREMAFRWSRPGHMWVRLGLAEAKAMISDGSGIVVSWHQHGPAE